MSQKTNISNLFKEDKHIDFDFSQAPTLIRNRSNSLISPTVSEKGTWSRWMKAQNSFSVCTKDRRIFTKEYIESNKTAYDALFNRIGFLKGKILDIGGGWGLYRQWWQPSESDIFVVHDPGIQRFLDGPHQLHYQYYQRAFSLPLTFVEGFGEELPYKDNSFDTCLIAATLDHCLSPQKVCAEAYRCLRTGGTVLVIQICHSSHVNTTTTYIRELVKHLRHPSGLLTVFYNRLSQASHHLHRFSSSDLASLLQEASFSGVHAYVVPTLKNVDVFVGIKKPPDSN